MVGSAMGRLPTSNRFAIGTSRRRGILLAMSQQKLTHLDEQGRARMVDVGHKPTTARQAIAEGFITISSQTLRAIAEETVPKGEVLGTARIAGILAAKR
jgi:cyclic pyranopterin phosphate synthase